MYARAPACAIYGVYILRTQAGLARLASPLWPSMRARPQTGAVNGHGKPCGRARLRLWLFTPAIAGRKEQKHAKENRQNYGGQD